MRTRRAGLTAQFLMAVGHELGEEGLTPSVLARAVTRVLPVDGAGLSSLVGALRMPLGASSEDVARGEELQTTLGEGPCLNSAETQTPVALDLDELTTRWPLYADGLTRRTPFKAVIALPLRAPGDSVFAALDLYTTSPRLDGRLDLTEIDQRVAAPAAALLSTCVDQIGDPDDPTGTPEWYQSATGRRHNAWVAIGMVMANQAVPRHDVLSLLRAHAYAEDRSLDDVTADVVKGRVSTTDLSS